MLAILVSCSLPRSIGLPSSGVIVFLCNRLFSSGFYSVDLPCEIRAFVRPHSGVLGVWPRRVVLTVCGR